MFKRAQIWKENCTSNKNFSGKNAGPFLENLGAVLWMEVENVLLELHTVIDCLFRKRRMTENS